MNKICKSYIKDIKTIFPILGKSERKYLKKLENNIENYALDNPNLTIENLYIEFGKPEEVLSTYLTFIDTKYLIKRLNTSKWIRILVAVLLVLTISFTVFYSTMKYMNNKIFEEEKAVFIEETIE